MDNSSKKTTQDQERAGDATVEASCHRYTSAELFRGSREILIIHGDHAYRLRITRQDKLILTK